MGLRQDHLGHLLWVGCLTEAKMTRVMRGAWTVPPGTPRQLIKGLQKGERGWQVAGKRKTGGCSREAVGENHKWEVREATCVHMIRTQGRIPSSSSSPQRPPCTWGPTTRKSFLGIKCCLSLPCSSTPWWSFTVQMGLSDASLGWGRSWKVFVSCNG